MKHARLLRKQSMPDLQEKGEHTIFINHQHRTIAWISYMYYFTFQLDSYFRIAIERFDGTRTQRRDVETICAFDDRVK